MCYEFTLNSREVVSSIQVNKYFNTETRACVLQTTLTMVNGFGIGSQLCMKRQGFG